MNRIIDYFRNLVLRKKLVFFYILIALPTLLVGILSYVQFGTTYRQQLSTNLTHAMSNFKKSFDTDAYRYKNLNAQIVSNTKLISIASYNYKSIVVYSYDLRDYLDPFFSSAEFMDDNIESITLYQENCVAEFGEYILDASRISNSDWYESIYSSIKQKWIYDDGKLLVIKPFSQFFMNERRSMMVITINLTGLIESYSLDDEDNYGILVLSDNDTVVYEKSLGIKAIDISKFDNSNQPIEFTDNGKKVIAKKSKLEDLGFNIIMYTYVNDLPYALGILKVTLQMILLSIILIGILMYLLEKTLFKPLINLNDDITRVEKGDLDIQIENTTKDEIGHIHRQFGKMVSRVKFLIEENIKANNVKKDAEMIALRSQINPHFLYNSLSTIAWKAMFNNDDEVREIATTLATFYRTMLNSGNKMINVRNEINNIQSYIKIRKIMKSDTFDVIYDIDENIYNYKMLNFLLQPIVENAVVHGVSAVTDVKGVLKISAYVDDGNLVFIIEDNGPGMTDNQMLEILEKKGKGYGVYNVNQRINLYYGDNYHLLYEHAGEEGIRVIISIPVEL